MLAGATEVNFAGSLEAEIAFIGESPGFEELREGEPFIGRSGRLLKKNVDKYNIPMNICFFANSARCMLEKEGLTTKEVNSILSACKPKLDAVLHHIKPKVIVVLGAIALQQIMRMKGIKKARGNFYWSEEYDCWVLPNWHPAYILRNVHEEGNFEKVFVTLQKFVENDFKVEEDEAFDYMEVDSIRELLDGGFMRSADDSCFITAIDTETQGLDWFRGSQHSPVLSYSVAVSETEAWNVVLREEIPFAECEDDMCCLVMRGDTKKAREWVNIGTRYADDYETKIEELKELLSRKDIQKYYMNQKYEMHRFEQLGIDVTDPEQFANNPIDISLLAHTFDAPRYMNANLGYLLESYCDINAGYKDEWTEAELSDMIAQMHVDRDKYNRRACFDAIATLKVALKQIEELNLDRYTLNYYINFAHPIETGILYELERNGVEVDIEALPEISDEISTTMTQKIEEFKKLCPEPVVNKHHAKFKLTRRSILMDVLFKYEDQDKKVTVDLGFGLTPKELSPKTKLPKVSKDILKVLLDEDIAPEAKDLIHLYQEWSEYHTLKSRYISQIEDNVSSDHRLYPTYSLTYTSSGRTGARKPSVQNFPKRSAGARLIRRLIVARKGYKLLETDHSMSELRWTAEVADERVMKEIFRQGGDIHLFTGANIARHPVSIAPTNVMKAELAHRGVNGDEIKQIRQNAKAVNFGLIYLMSAYGLRSYAYQGFGVKLSEEESRDWREDFFNLYPGIAPWHDREIKHMEAHGSITTVFGRRIPVPNVYSYEKAAQREAQRFGVNAKIQGPSSDYTLMGGNKVIKLDDYTREECVARLFIHDAFVWEVREDLVDKYAKLITEGLVNIDTSKFNFQLSIPFVANAEVGDNLAEMEELNLEEVN
jgi:uracil-DNA glycosylase family 4